MTENFTWINLNFSKALFLVTLPADFIKLSPSLDVDFEVRNCLDIKIHKDIKYSYVNQKFLILSFPTFQEDSPDTYSYNRKSY